jgi:hypothetical protein
MTGDKGPVGSSGPASEILHAGRNVLTDHSLDAYPGIRVIRPGRWDRALIVPEQGQTIAALGGEEVFPYETVDGGHAQGFVLRPGDRATLVRKDLEYCLAEWHIERAIPV